MKRKQWILPVIIAILVLLVTAAFVQMLTGVPLNTPFADGGIANSFLGTIAQVLGGILAIVLSLSVLGVEIASDKYTPRLLSYYRNDKVTWLILICFVVCIVISVVAMGIQTIPP